MWVNRAERSWRRREEAEIFARATAEAEAKLASASFALKRIRETTNGEYALCAAIPNCVGLGRTSRLSRNGVAGGTAVLEAVVIRGVASRALSDPALVRWLASHLMDALTRLHEVASFRGVKLISPASRAAVTGELSDSRQEESEA